MTVVYPGKDPMAPLAFMTGSTRIPFELALMDGGYMATRSQLIQVLDQHLDGMYEILLGDERKLTDTTAEFVVYVEHEESARAQALIEYIKSGNTSAS